MGSGIFGLAGTLIGGLIAYLTSHTLNNKERREKQQEKRTKLYADFVAAIREGATAKRDGKTNYDDKIGSVLAEIELLAPSHIAHIAWQLLYKIRNNKKIDSQYQEKSVRQMTDIFLDIAKQDLLHLNNDTSFISRNVSVFGDSIKKRLQNWRGTLFV